MIEITQLNKYYTVNRRRNDLRTVPREGTKYHVLKDLSLTVRKGDFLGIMGRSGAGKTTLLNIIGGIDSFDSGSYRFNGTEIKGLSDAKLSRIRNREIGFVLQDFALLNQESVLFNTMLPMYFGKTPRRRMKAAALDVLERVGIADQAYKKAIYLSGGQRQRVAIARSIVNHPSVVLADEPTGALDTQTAKQIMELLRSLNDSGITIIIVTHDPLVANCCRTVAEISDGILSQ